MKLMWSEKEIEDIRVLYFEEYKTLKEISELYNVAVNSIKKLLKTYFLEEYKIASKRNYKNLSIDHNFFEKIDTEEKAYILGFLLADGNIYISGNSYKLRFSIAIQDINILYKIKDILHLNSKIGIQKRKGRENSQEECYLSWTSKKQFKDLEKYGIVPNKTFVSIFPINEINPNVRHHFIRGFFDGDGCVSISIEKNRQAVSFVGTYHLIYDLREYLCRVLNIYNVVISERTKKNTMYQIMWSSKETVKLFYNYLYKDATIYLERKKEKFELLF